jgi:uncharacterized protein YaeQ
VALTATVYRLQIQLSDVDRGVYQALDLRMAQHPSETARYLLTRTLAYALSFEEGLAFSKGGLSAVDEPPLSLRDPTGRWLAWIEIGMPSADRLHKATKQAPRVELYTTQELTPLLRELESRSIHRQAEIAVWQIEANFVAGLEAKLQKNLNFELTRSDGQLWANIDGDAIEGAIRRRSLDPANPA